MALISRFDHAVVGVHDLDAAIAHWRDRLGFDARPGGRHGGGTHNGIVRFGTDYIELISVFDRDAVLASGIADTNALLDLIDRQEGGLLGFICATDDADAAAVHFRGLGLPEVVGPFAMERRRPDGRLLHWRLLSPRRQSWGRPWTMLIHWGIPDAERLSWEPPGQHPNGARQVVAVAVAIGDLAAGREFYERDLGLSAVAEDDVADVGARRVSYRIGPADRSIRVDLLAPTGPGPVDDAVKAGREQLFQLTIGVADLAASRAFMRERNVHMSDTSGGLLIDPADALGARIVLVETG